MSLKFWLGGAKSDRSRQLIKYILEEAEAHPDRHYLFVAPEQFGLAAQRELVLNSKNHGILNIDVLSFTRLAHRISDEVGSYETDVTMLGETGKSLIIGMLANSMRDDLAVFGKDIDRLGYIDRFKSVISEFMQYGITVDKAFEMAQSAKSAGRGQLAAKLNDVAAVYKAFREYIKDRYTTIEETLDVTSRLVPQSETIKNSVVVFDGFTGFTPVQNKLIGVLMEYAISVHVSLLYEDCIQENKKKGQIQEHELFYLSKHTMDQLGRMADERRVIIEDPYKADKREIGNICDLISGIVYKQPDTESVSNNTSVHVFAAANPDEEIRMVASKIRDIIREEGYRYRDIAILAGDIQSYHNPVERVLAYHDIPFFVDVTEPVLLNPFIEYIRSFIDILCDNYSQAAVFSFLKSRLAGFADDDIYALENYCLAANIKGYKKWHERFDMHTNTAGADELLVLNAIRERLIAKTGLFTSQLDTNTPGSGKDRTAAGAFNAGSKFTVREFATALYSVIVSDGIEDELKDASKRFEDSGQRRLAAEYGGIYVKIMGVLDELCDLIPDEKTDIRGFAALLDAGLDQIRIGTIPEGMDYIQVADLTRSRLGDIKALFIVGANDGYIPKTGTGTGLISESEREFLTGSDDQLVLAPTAKENMYTQQLYIYMATAKPQEHLFVSYSHVNAAGKSLLPSYIVKKITALYPSLSVKKAQDIPDHYTDEKEAFDDLAAMLYPAITGKATKEGAQRVKELAKYFLASDTYRERLWNIIEKDIFRGATEDTIGAHLAKVLYGRKISASITRLENYAKCAYRYFLQYGLKLTECEIFSFESSDIGNIFHDSMKRYSLLMEKEGHDWYSVSESERESLMDTAVSAVIENYRSEKLSSSARYAYMEGRIRTIMRRTADIISDQIKKGEFRPKYFEVDFDRMDEVDSLSVRLSDEEVMRLRGRIDRVDTAETDDGIYVRIIDYKSSQHDMDLAAVYEGRQLQLLVYLNAAMEMEREEETKKGGNREIFPAGVLYYHIDDPMIAADKELTDDELHALIMKHQAFSGLVSDTRSVVELMDKDIATDPTVVRVSLTSKGEIRSTKSTVGSDDFGILTDHVNKCMAKMGSEITNGNIAIPEPDNRTRFTGPDCSFCPYTAICIEKGDKAVTMADTGEDSSEDGEGAAVKLGRMTNKDWIARMKPKKESEEPEDTGEPGGEGE